MTGDRIVELNVILCTHANVWYVNSVSVPMLAFRRVLGVVGRTLLLDLVGSAKR